MSIDNQSSNKFYKIKLLLALGFMSALSPLSIDMYLPALSQIQQSFATTTFNIQLSLVAFFIAFALGQLVHGPLSDIHGRKKPLYIGLIIFIIASFGCFMTENIYVFIFFRFLQAFGSCAGVVIARAIINDKFELNEAASMFAIMMSITSLAPVFAPSFGSIILTFAPWRIVFLLLCIIAIVLVAMIYFWIGEENQKNKNPEIKIKKVLMGYFEILKDKDFMIYALLLAIPMSALFAYITGSSFIFIDYFGLSTQQYGIIFGVNAFSVTFVAIINSRLVLKHSPQKFLKLGFILSTIFAIILIAFGVFMPSFIFFEIALLVSLASLGLILPNSTSLAMALYRGKNSSGSASAFLGAVQFTFAGISSFAVGALHANNPLFLSLVMGSCILIASTIYFISHRNA